MTDEARIARITQLAGKVYGSRDTYGRLSVVRDTGGGVDVTEAGGVLIAIGDHPHALEALETALRVMLARTIQHLTLRVEKVGS